MPSKTVESRTDRLPWLRLAAFSAAAVVFMLSLAPLPQVQSAELVPQIDKLVHLVLYAVLTRLFIAAYPSTSRWQLATMLAGYGMAIECLQQLSPTRAAEAADAVANCVGICLALWHPRAPAQLSTTHDR